MNCTEYQNQVTSVHLINYSLIIIVILILGYKIIDISLDAFKQIYIISNFFLCVLYKKEYDYNYQS